MFFVLFNVFCINAQKANDIWIEGRFKMGFLAAHRSTLGHLPSEHAFAAEINYLLQPHGKKRWQVDYNYPVYGVTLFGGTVGNTKLLGYYYGAYGFINFPLFTRKHYVFSAKVGTGIAYGAKYYDAISNKLGIAVSTPLNALVCLGLDSRFRFKGNSITVSLDLTHFSNGATKVPNFGLNLPYVSIGYGHRIKKARDTSFVTEPFKKSWQFGFTAIGSVKEVYPTGGRKYGVFSLNLLGRRFFRPKTGMEVSLDFMSNQAILAYHPDVPKKQSEIWQLGLFTGYILPLDKFHLLIGMGAYLRDKYHPDEFLYHRLGMRYVFKKGININLTLKTHWARADYIEYGIGYTFNK